MEAKLIKIKPLFNTIIATADKYKEDDYFTKLASFYEDANHLQGLYQYLLYIPIMVNMKGDAPMTSTKEILKSNSLRGKV